MIQLILFVCFVGPHGETCKMMDPVNMPNVWRCKAEGRGQVLLLGYDLSVAGRPHRVSYTCQRDEES